MSTLSDLKIYYADLLIMQYRGQDVNRDTIKAFANIALIADASGDLIVNKVRDAFNLIGDNTAIGKQLDTIGKYVGVDRYGIVNNSNITLDDNDFLTLIKLAASYNTMYSSLYEIQRMIKTFFDGSMLVFDYQNMRMSYMISSDIGTSDFVLIAIQKGLLPKPQGVQLASTIYYDNITLFFGFRTYSIIYPNNTPFNNYTSYNTTWRFLSYSMALT